MSVHKKWQEKILYVIVWVWSRDSWGAFRREVPARSRRRGLEWIVVLGKRRFRAGASRGCAEILRDVGFPGCRVCYNAGVVAGAC